MTTNPKVIPPAATVIDVTSRARLRREGQRAGRPLRGTR